MVLQVPLFRIRVAFLFPVPRLYLHVVLEPVHVQRLMRNLAVLWVVEYLADLIGGWV